MDIQRNLISLMKTVQVQVFCRVYMYQPEDTYQEDIEHNMFPVLLTNQRVYMKHTSASIQAAPLTTVP